MKSGKLTFGDYVKAAFGWRYRVPLLGHMPVNVFALAGFAILGLGHPAFWLLGLAYESGYLLFLAGSARFQKVVDGTRLLAAQQMAEKRQQALLQGLDRPSRERFQQVSQQCLAVIDHARLSGSEADDLRAHGLSQLLETFLQLLTSRMRNKGILAQVSEKALKEEIARIGERIAHASPDTALHRSLQGSLEIANMRLANLTRAAESLTVVEAELDRIEKQFALLVEESSISGNPALLTAKLDGVMQSLQDTSRWLQENREFLDTMDDSTSKVAVLPVRGKVNE
jgi:hypothetical protein